MPGYIALVHKDEGTSYGVSFPDVPGCIAAGDTFEEAVANAAAALAAHFALMKADGDPIPAPHAFEQLQARSGVVEDSADAIVTMVTPRRKSATDRSSRPRRGRTVEGRRSIEDIAALAVFLASDAAKSISGQVLPIDNDRQRA